MTMQVIFKIDDVLLKLSKNNMVLTFFNWVFKPLEYLYLKIEVITDLTSLFHHCGIKKVKHRNNT